VNDVLEMMWNKAFMILVEELTRDLLGGRGKPRQTSVRLFCVPTEKLRKDLPYERHKYRSFDPVQSLCIPANNYEHN
jgi:hypothetical protein